MQGFLTTLTSDAATRTLHVPQRGSSADRNSAAPADGKTKTFQDFIQLFKEDDTPPVPSRVAISQPDGSTRRNAGLEDEEGDLGSAADDVVAFENLSESDSFEFLDEEEESYLGLGQELLGHRENGVSLATRPEMRGPDRQFSNESIAMGEQSFANETKLQSAARGETPKVALAGLAMPVAGQIGHGEHWADGSALVADRLTGNDAQPALGLTGATERTTSLLNDVKNAALMSPEGNDGFMPLAEAGTLAGAAKTDASASALDNVTKTMIGMRVANGGEAESDVLALRSGAHSGGSQHQQPSIPSNQTQVSDPGQTAQAMQGRSGDTDLRLATDMQVTIRSAAGEAVPEQDVFSSMQDAYSSAGRPATPPISGYFAVTGTRPISAAVDTSQVFALEGDAAGGLNDETADSPVPGDLRMASALMPESRGYLGTLAQSVQTARHVAGQIHDVMAKAADRPIDIILNPAELGRVRITLSHSDAGMIVNVAAERTETLDLMRRHSDILGQEFHDLGYGGTEFTFDREQSAQDGGPHGPARHDEAPATVLAESAGSPMIATPAPAVPVDRLDIRL
ncbi:flagellar hook-length control protein FliK [Roseovarius sp. Pro17]|uniref:flagellar hook-length control protein FliK n=1 Tax=Roseovarius sp. Pro17 TaxID=3108175 RepID=UPI002D78509F|nr:flagellar hook-length control protein FliK [Roseovarius sp. Pro17]